jgi:UDP-N-acetylglucosamine 2-epimerase (non-hydrolysing)
LNKILFVFGTRPEAIKMAPLVKEFQRHTDKFTVEVCLTGQHRQMLNQVNAFFGIQADYDLNLMQPNQTLSDLTARCLIGLCPVIESSKPDLVFVQGDTTTMMAGALAAFYMKVPVAHLEAGLRSGNNYSPYPEEMNRKIAGQISSWHFAPTLGAKENLRKEGITRNVHVVGNTVIDALLLAQKLIHERDDEEFVCFFNFIDFSKRIILVTGHRRESFGDGFENICAALKKIAESRNDIEVVYPVHLNPNVHDPVNRLLSGLPNVHLIEPIDYPRLVWLMEKSYFVLTDSGGLQEEAPALGKPVLVMREVTEREEGVKAGTARLVGTDKEAIICQANLLLDSEQEYQAMAKATNPYGDGMTSNRIVAILDEKIVND